MSRWLGLDGVSAITAQYQGSSDYIGSVSTDMSQEVIVPLVTVNVGSTSLTVPVGQSGVVQLTIGSAGTLSAPVTFACSGLPIGSECVFSPTSVGAGSLPARVGLTVTTTRLKIMGQMVPSRVPWTFAALFPAMCLLPFAGKRGKGRWLSVTLGLVLLMILTFAVGCGSGNSGITNVQQSTTPGSYNVTLTATSTAATQSSTNFNLIVTP